MNIMLVNCHPHFEQSIEHLCAMRNITTEKVHNSYLATTKTIINNYDFVIIDTKIKDEFFCDSYLLQEYCGFNCQVFYMTYSIDELSKIGLFLGKQFETITFKTVDNDLLSIFIGYHELSKDEWDDFLVISKKLKDTLTCSNIKTYAEFKEKILLVDCHPIVFEGLKRLSSHYNFTVESITSSMESPLEKIINGNYGFVIFYHDEHLQSRTIIPPYLLDKYSDITIPAFHMINKSNETIKVGIFIGENYSQFDFSEINDHFINNLRMHYYAAIDTWVGYLKAAKKINTKENREINQDEIKKIIENKRIIIIDDDPIISDMFAQMLNKAFHCVVDCAQSGDDALIKISKYSYELVFTDLTMPGMDGLTLIKEIKKINPLLPIFVQSGFKSSDKESQAIDAGAVCVLAKPVTIDDVSNSLLEYYPNIQETIEENT